MQAASASRSSVQRLLGCHQCHCSSERIARALQVITKGPRSAPPSFLFRRWSGGGHRHCPVSTGRIGRHLHAARLLTPLIVAYTADAISPCARVGLAGCCDQGRGCRAMVSCMRSTVLVMPSTESNTSRVVPCTVCIDVYSCGCFLRIVAAVSTQGGETVHTQ